MELFYEDGRAKFLGQRLKECSVQYNTSIVEGVGQVVDFKGYEYQDLYKYSFTDVIQAYGIRQNGSDYIEWETTELHSLDREHVIFIIEMAMGNGRAYPQPSGRFDLYLNGQHIISFTVVKQSAMWTKDNTRLYFEMKKKKAGNVGQSYTLDEWIQNDSLVVNGTGYLRVPISLLNGEKKARIRIVPVNRETSANWLRIGKCRSMLLTNIYDGLDEVHTGRKQLSLADYNIYFGDIHTHSGDGEFLDTEGCGTGTWKENFDFARDVAGLDFFCMTDHDWQLGRDDWRNLKAISDSYNQDGRFATLRGYEWTSTLYGHRNVYFREGDIDEVLDFRAEKIPVRFGMQGSSKDDPTPADLWAWLDENNLEAITVPHHSNADQFIMNFNAFFNPKYDRLVEIYSSWGRSDQAFSDLNVNNDKYPQLNITNFMAKYRFGLIASSDGHDGNPGNASLCRGHRYFLGHPAGSGRAVVLAKELTRNAVYDALKQRRCYATTGTPMGLYFSVNGHELGSIVKGGNEKSPAELKLIVKAVDNIKKIDIIKNGEIHLTLRDIESSGIETEIVDPQFESAEDSYYYVKVVQEDGEMAWSSPVYFAGT